MTPPRHGGQLRHLAQSYTLDPKTILDFSANINPEGPVPAVLAALREALEDPNTLTHYPDLDLTDLHQAIIEHHNPALFTPAHLAIANGFVPLLDATIHALGLTRTVLPTPSFSEYRTTLERCHATPIPHPLNLEHFLYDPDHLTHTLATTAADSLLLANPQNPSGVLTPSHVLLTLATANPQITLLVDEAFIDYIPRGSLIPHLANHPNLIVFRSVTKFHAIPGLRVAYAAGHPATMRKLRHQLPPWPISTLATIATIAALQTPTRPTINLNQSRRTQLLEQLAPLGITCPPPAANFLLLRTPVPALQLWQKLLEHHHILLRRCENFESLGPNHLRTAVRNEHDNARLMAALTASL